MINSVGVGGPGGDQLLGGRDRGSQGATGRVRGRGPAGGALGKHASPHKPCPPKSTPTGPKACSWEETPQTHWEEKGSAAQHQASHAGHPSALGSRDLLGDAEPTPWALRAGTQRPGPGPGPGCAAL